MPLNLGKVDLLPKEVLRRLSEEDPGAGPNAAPRPELDVSRQAATARLADRLDPALEGQDLVLVGTVAAMPRTVF